MDLSCEQGSRNSQCSQNELEAELCSFIKAIDIEYGAVQNRTSPSLRLSKIQSLRGKLTELQRTLTPGSRQKIFIEYVLRYVEICLEFVTNYEDVTSRKQYATLLLSFIPEFFQDPDIKNMFVKDATVKIFDMFMYGCFDTISKKALLSVFNTIASQAQHQVCINTAENIIYYVYKLIDCLSTCGDYEMQSEIMKTVYGIFGSHIRNNQLQYDLVPGSKKLNEGLATKISVVDFDADVRRWLNTFNDDSRLIFSLPCTALMFGSIACKCPDEGPDGIWVDFDLKDYVISFNSIDSSGKNSNRIMIMANDVKQVQADRQFKSSKNTTVALHLSKPVIRESPNNQVYSNYLDTHFKIIINAGQKEKTNQLILRVLPHMFQEKFLHTSARLSNKIKNVYKPLRVKISKRKSTSSELSSSTSKSKSDVNLEKYSVIQPEPPKHSVSRIEVDQPTIAEVKQSQLKPYTLLRSDVSLIVSDFTKNSSRPSELTFDDVSIISSNNSALFESRRSSADLLQGNEKLQDNIVTSSHGINDDLETSLRIEILSGQCSGRQPVFISETTDFEPSEIFTSSPIKRSKQIIRNLSDDFHSARSENSEKKEDLDDTKNNSVVPKMSALVISEDVLDEFETAVENLDLAVVCENMFDNALAKEEYKDNNDKNKKVSQYANQNYLSEEELQNKSKKISSAISNNDELLNKMGQNKANSIVQIPKQEERKSATDILTQDLFEIPTQPNIQPEREVYSEANSEDIFSRATLPNQTLELRDELIEYNFTELSLAVNVGVSDNHYSDEPAVTGKRIYNDTDIGITIIPSDTANEDKNEEDVGLIDESAAKFAGENNKENFIDFAEGGNVHVEEIETSNATQKQCFMNTPELIDALTLDDSQPKVLKGLEFSGNKKKLDSITENENEQKKMPIKKKKARHLIRTGRKQFCLQEVDSEALSQTDLVQNIQESDNYNEGHRTAIPVSDVRDETSNVLSSQSEKNQNECISSQGSRLRVGKNADETKDQIINVSSESGVLEITENQVGVNLIGTPSQSKNQNEDHILSQTSGRSGFIERESAVENKHLGDILGQTESRVETKELSQASELSDFIQKEAKKGEAKILSQEKTPLYDDALEHENQGVPIENVIQATEIEAPNEHPPISTTVENGIQLTEVESPKKAKVSAIIRKSEKCRAKDAIDCKIRIPLKERNKDQTLEVEKHQEFISEEIQIMEENDNKVTYLKYGSPVVKNQNAIVENENRKSTDLFDVLLADTAKPIKVDITSNMQEPNEDRFQKRTVSPILKINKSADDFSDILLANDSELSNPNCNNTKCKTTIGNKTRKLYNEGSFSYLDDMRVVEQSTPELKTSPIFIEKETKVPRQKKPRTKKRNEEGDAAKNATKESSSKNKTKDSFKANVKKKKPIAEQSIPELKTSPFLIEKETKVPRQKKPRTKKRNEESDAAKNTTKESSLKNKTKDSFKAEVKKRKPIAKKTELSIDPLSCKRLHEQFDRTCIDLLNQSRASNCAFFECSKLKQPLDIVRAFHHSSSDESSVLDTFGTKTNKKLNLTKIVYGSETPPHSSDFNWPELEVEPVKVNTFEKWPKVRILQDIVIKPKRAIEEETSPQMSKKLKIDEVGIEENIPLSNLPEDNLRLPEEIGCENLSKVLKLMKFIITLMESKQDPNSLQKFKLISDVLHQLPEEFFR